MSEAAMSTVTGDPALLLQSSPGANLAATRQAYGLTVEQVANQLNLAPRQVVALETDDYAMLPATAIARGFLRSYAKLLHLDSAPLLAMLAPAPLPGSIRGNGRANARDAARNIARTQYSATQNTNQGRAPQTSARAYRGKAVPIVAGLVALVAAATVSYAMGWLPSALHRKASLDQSNAMADGQADMVQGFSGAPAHGSQASGSAQHGAAGYEIAQGAEAGSLTLLAPGSDKPGQRSPAAAAEPAREVLPAISVGVLEQSLNGARAKPAMSATSTNPLVLNVQKDSWVEIKRADNTTLLAKTVKGGSVETFDVNEPLTLTVGNAAGVEASLRGAPLQLASIGNGNVARVKLK